MKFILFCITLGDRNDYREKLDCPILVNSPSSAVSRARRFIIVPWICYAVLDIFNLYIL